ncbi:MAG: GDSL-type esterase/lipase family protein [Cyanobacteria bacterium P01_H01_bin.15]
MTAIASSERPKVVQPSKILAFGDSLVYGYGDPDGGGWAERLRRRWLGIDGPILYNLGVRGDRLGQVCDRFESEFSRRGELRNQLPQGVIVCVGVNDSARLGRNTGRHFTELEQFQQQWWSLLSQIRKYCPVLVVGMVPVDESKMPFIDCLYYSRASQYLYKEATKAVCQTHQVPYLDTFDLWRAQGEDWIQARLCADGLHPNSAGHEAIFDAVTTWSAFSQLQSPTVAIA